MPGRLLPPFPLDAARLPHARLPLHSFEESDKEMTGEGLVRESESGAVSRRDGGSPRAGCSASIVDVPPRLQNGRMDLLPTGGRRFEIEEIDEGRSFPRAGVRFSQDSGCGEPPAETVGKALQAYALLTDSSGQDTPEERAPELGFRLAAISGGHGFRQMLLASPGEAERMERAAGHLAWLVRGKQTRRAVKQTRRAVKQTRRAVKNVARSNGHGRQVLELGEEK